MSPTIQQEVPEFIFEKFLFGQNGHTTNGGFRRSWTERVEGRRSVVVEVAGTCALSLFERLQSRRARAGVVGFGYVGLPLAVELVPRPGRSDLSACHGSAVVI
jgi:hypothetical protein